MIGRATPQLRASASRAATRPSGVCGSASRSGSSAGVAQLGARRRADRGEPRAVAAPPRRGGEEEAHGRGRGERDVVGRRGGRRARRVVERLGDRLVEREHVDLRRRASRSASGSTSRPSRARAISARSHRRRPRAPRRAPRRPRARARRRRAMPCSRSARAVPGPIAATRDARRARARRARRRRAARTARARRWASVTQTRSYAAEVRAARRVERLRSRIAGASTTVGAELAQPRGQRARLRRARA